MNQLVQNSFDLTEWKYATDDVLQREQISNRLAYNKSRATLALILKRSARGDYALSQYGLDYLLKLLNNGGKDSSPEREAIVVLGNVGKPVKTYTAEELRDRFSGVEPEDGKFGPYWWIPAPAIADDDAPW